MNFNFRKVFPRLPNLAFCALGVMAILGLINSSNVSPDPLLKYWSLGAAVFCGFIGWCLLAGDRNPSSKLNSSGPVKRCLGLAFGCFFFAVFGYFSVLLGLPTIFSRVVLKPTTGQSSVAYVLKERSGRGCHYRVELRGDALKESMTTCVPKDLWSALRVGDPVLVSYTQSLMGFVLEDIQKLPSP